MQLQQVVIHVKMSHTGLVLLSILTVVCLQVTEGCVCYAGQTVDPSSTSSFKPWVLLYRDPCGCTSLVPGGFNAQRSPPVWRHSAVTNPPGFTFSSGGDRASVKLSLGCTDGVTPYTEAPAATDVQAIPGIKSTPINLDIDTESTPHTATESTQQHGDATGSTSPNLHIVLTAVTEMTTNEGIESNANAATSALVGISEPPLFPEPPCDFWGYHTTDNNYVYVFPFPAFDPAKELYVRFGVRTGMSALLALTLNNQNPTRYEDALYEIVIDYRYSETSGIRRCKDCQNVVSVMDAANRLDDDVYKYFWLRYKTGFIQVGRRGEAQAFLAWQDGAPLSVRYLGLASNGWRSNWRICENMAVMH